jgi:hypothetical protein
MKKYTKRTVPFVYNISAACVLLKLNADCTI